MPMRTRRAVSLLSAVLTLFPAARPFAETGRSCFAEAPVSPVAAAATVYIDAAGQLGSGFVVANSAVHGTNRILTTQHIPYPRQGDQSEPAWISITDSAGGRLGEAAVVARGGWRMGTGPIDAWDTQRNGHQDITVLEMRGFATRESGQAYRQIEGITLAPVQSPTLFDFKPTPESDAHAGPVGGGSGGPALDSNNRALGLVHGIADDEKGQRLRRVHTYGNMAARIQDGTPFTEENIFFPAILDTKITPISSPAILRALGAAGRDVTTAPLTQTQEGVTVLGYASGYCTVFRGSAYDENYRPPAPRATPFRVPETPQAR